MIGAGQKPPAQEKSLRVYTLGNFVVQCGDRKISETPHRSSRLWSLFNYLIINRSRSIAAEELLEVIWDDAAAPADPEHALRTLIYRLRKLFSSGCDAEAGEIILSTQGRYRWNSDNSCWFDAKEFEDLCHRGLQQAESDPGAALTALKKGLALYRGDYLEQLSYTAWVEPQRNFYRRLYVDSVYCFIELLKSLRRHKEIAKICEKATRIEPFEEGLHLCFMESLLEQGKNGPARAHYEYITALFYREMGVKPSPAMRDLYRRLKLTHETVEMDVTIITESLQERALAPGAFQCDPEIFRYLYKLEERKIKRSGQSVFLVLFSLTCPDFNLPEQKELQAGMHLLSNVLIKSLRQGDVVTRWNEAQYLTLLQSLTHEQTEIVTQRVERHYREEAEASRLKSVILRAKTLPISSFPPGE